MLLVKPKETERKKEVISNLISNKDQEKENIDPSNLENINNKNKVIAKDRSPSPLSNKESPNKEVLESESCDITPVNENQAEIKDEDEDQNSSTSKPECAPVEEKKTKESETQVIETKIESKETETINNTDISKPETKESEMLISNNEKHVDSNKTDSSKIKKSDSLKEEVSTKNIIIEGQTDKENNEIKIEKSNSISPKEIKTEPKNNDLTEKDIINKSLDLDKTEGEKGDSKVKDKSKELSQETCKDEISKSLKEDNQEESEVSTHEEIGSVKENNLAESNDKKVSENEELNKMQDSVKVNKNLEAEVSSESMEAITIDEKTEEKQKSDNGSNKTEIVKSLTPEKLNDSESVSEKHEGERKSPEESGEGIACICKACLMYSRKRSLL